MRRDLGVSPLMMPWSSSSCEASGKGAPRPRRSGAAGVPDRADFADACAAPRHGGETVSASLPRLHTMPDFVQQEGEAFPEQPCLERQPR